MYLFVLTIKWLQLNIHKLNRVNHVFKLYKHSFRFYSHSKQHCGENNERSNPCLISTRGERRNSKSLECVDTWFPEVVWDQGWEVSPLYGKNQGNYPVSDNTAEILSTMGEMAERGETKFGENCHENTQLIETLTV